MILWMVLQRHFWKDCSLYGTKMVLIGESCAVVVATGIGRGASGLEETSKQIEYALTLEGMEVLEKWKIA